MRVIVADDSAVIRAGVARILTDAGLEVVAEASTADEALEGVEKHRPDLAVLDIRMPPSGNAGLLAAETIRDRYGGTTAVLVLSQYLEPEYALAARPGCRRRRLPAQGVRRGRRRARRRARRVAGGGSAIDPAVVEELVRAQRRQDPLSTLTARERSVLALVAEGRSTAPSPTG